MGNIFTLYVYFAIGCDYNDPCFVNEMEMGN